MEDFVNRFMSKKETSFSKTYITKIHTNIKQTNSVKVKKIKFVIYPLFFLLLWPNTRQATEEDKFYLEGT